MVIWAWHLVFFAAGFTVSHLVSRALVQELLRERRR